MRKPWKPIHRQQLVEDHQNRLPLKDLVIKYGGSVDKVRAFLVSEQKYIPYKKGTFELDVDDIIRLYKDDVSKEEIAKRYKCSVGPIITILNKSGVRKPSWAKGISYSKYELLNDKESFIQNVDNFVSKTLMCEHYGVGMDMISSLYKRYEVDTNSAQVRSLLNRKVRNGIPVTKEEFCKQHFKHNKSVQNIALMMGISTNYLRTYIRKWAVDTRDTRISLKFRAFKKLSTDTIQQMVNNTHVTKLFTEFEVSYGVFRAELVKKNINIPPRFMSIGERSIGDFVENLNISVVRNTRKIIYPYELDIFIPSHNLAIEYCGLYWHSELNNRGRDYHIKKLKMCNKKGIRLLTIFEDEYLGNEEFVENKIQSILNALTLTNINARHCTVGEIDFNLKSNFLNKYHIQGNDTSKYYLGLFHENELVSVMTFAKPSKVRSSVKHQKAVGLWELNRFASHAKYNVRGGAGKLLAHFKKHYEWSTIYSYADKRWSEGQLYNTLGFTQVKDSPPNYWYSPRGYYKREYRYNYAKYKLVEQGYDSAKTERQIMEDRGFTRVWDCGHYKFECHK